MSWNKQNNILSKQTFQTVSMHRLSLGDMTKQIKAMAGKFCVTVSFPWSDEKNISFFTWVYFHFLLDTESIYTWMLISVVEKIFSPRISKLLRLRLPLLLRCTGHELTKKHLVYIGASQTLGCLPYALRSLSVAGMSHLPVFIFSTFPHPTKE